MGNRGELNKGEYHPGADIALSLINKIGRAEFAVWVESFASVAIEGNRMAELCSETMHRLLNGHGVSDRYLMGLVMVMFADELEQIVNTKVNK